LGVRARVNSPGVTSFARLGQEEYGLQCIVCIVANFTNKFIAKFYLRVNWILLTPADVIPIMHINLVDEASDLNRCLRKIPVIRQVHLFFLDGADQTLRTALYRRYQGRPALGDCASCYVRSGARYR